MPKHIKPTTRSQVTNVTKGNTNVATATSVANKEKREPALLLINPLDLKGVTPEQFSNYFDALQVLSMNFLKKNFDGTAEMIDLLESVITSVDFFLTVSGLIQGTIAVADYVSGQRYKPKDATEWLAFLRPSRLARAKALAELYYEERKSELVSQPPSPIAEARYSWAQEVEMTEHLSNASRDLTKLTSAEIVRGTYNNVPAPPKKVKLSAEAAANNSSTSGTAPSPEPNVIPEKEWKRRRAHRQRATLTAPLYVTFQERVGRNMSQLNCCGLTSQQKGEIVDVVSTRPTILHQVVQPALKTFPLYYVKEVNDNEHFVENLCKWRTLPSYLCTADKSLWDSWPENLKRERY